MRSIFTAVFGLLFSSLVALAQTAPTITSQPSAAVSGSSGWATLTLTVAATSNSGGTLSYRWQRDGVDLVNGTTNVTLGGRFIASTTSGATSATLTIQNVLSSASGTYRAVVTDSAAPGLPATTSGTVLTVTDDAPVVTSQSPAILRVSPGGRARVYVNVTGSRPLNIQWFRNGTPIPGFSGSSFTAFDLDNIDAAKAGTYTATITNAFGTANVTPVQIELATLPDPLDTWQWESPDPQGNNITGMATGGNGRLVLVGRGGSVISTVDGESGNVGTSGDGNALASIIWDPAGQRYVAVGGFSTIRTSTDGINWTNASLTGAYDDGYTGIATDGAGKIVIVGADFNFRPTRALIRSSQNGGAWNTPSSVPSSFANLASLTGVAHGTPGTGGGAARFMAVGPGGSAYWSTDAMTWESATTGTSAQFNAVGFGNGRFVAVGAGGMIRISSDGSTFTAATSNTTQNLFAVKYLAASSTWVAVGALNTVVTSTDDGVTWISTQVPGFAVDLLAIGQNEFLTVVAGRNGRLLGTGTDTTFSAADLDLDFSEALQTDNTSFINFVDYDEQSQNFIAVGSAGNIHGSWRSGNDWWRRTQGPGGFLTQWVRFGSQLLVSGSAGIILQSFDNGFSWNSLGGHGSQQFNSIATNGSRAVVVGNAGVLYTSTDGSNWSAGTSGVSTTLRRVAHGNGRFVAVGGNDTGGTSITILTSNDGLTWTPRSAGTTGQLWGVDYANGTWIAVGAAGINGGSPFLLRSTDNGETWTRSELPGFTFCFTVRYIAGRWHVVGSPNVIAVSEDNGLTWNYKSHPAQPNVNTMRGIAASPDVFVIVGNDSAVLSSAPRGPQIVSLAAPAAISPNGPANLFVNAQSSYPLSFQWRFNGQPIEGQTNSHLWINNFNAANVGNYDVVVTATRSDDDGVTMTGVTVSQPVALSLAPAAGVSSVDFGFTRPQFFRHSLPGRITAGPGGVSYATFTNGRTLNSVDGRPVGAVVKLNADGTVDESFNPGAHLSDAWAVVPLTDGTGRVLVGAVVTGEHQETGPTMFRVVRLFANGQRDWSYFSPVFTGMPRYMTLQPDGKLLVAPATGAFTANGGVSNLVRLNADGSQDWSFFIPSFNSINPIFANIVIDGQGRILIGGTFNQVNGQARPGIARLNPDGSLDASFVPSGFNFPGGQVRGLGVQTQGDNVNKVLVAGGTFLVNGTSRPVLRLNTDGSLDSSFTLVSDGDVGANSATGLRVRLLNTLPNDQFTVVTTKLSRFNTDGSLDTAFVAPTFNQEPFWMDTLPDGRVLLPPEFGTTANGTPLNGPVRFTNTGALDATFAPGRFQTVVHPADAAIQPDGRVLTWGNFDAVGSTPRAGLARFNTNGSLDALALTGVADLYSVSSAAVLSDGRILASVLRGVHQTNLSTSLHRFMANGAVDNSFTLAAGANSAAFRVLNDGRILTWSLSAADFLNNRPVLQRLTADGALDAGFTSLEALSFGRVYRDANNAITQIVAGQFRIVGHYADGRALAVASSPTDNYAFGATALPVTLLRLNTNGTIDATFNAPALMWNTTASVTPATLDPVRNVTAQWNQRSIGGSPFSGVVPQADGGVIVYGAFQNLGGHAAPGIARLTNTGAVDTSFSVGSGPELRSLPYRAPLVQTVTIAPDGKIWVAGAFDTFGGRGAPGVVRLNADGTVDTSFAFFGTSYRQFLSNGAAIKFGPNGEVVFAGPFAQPWEFPFGLTRLTTFVAPTITTQPVGATMTAGGSITLSVGITPHLQASYQWLRNGVEIAGANQPTLTLTNFQPGDNGNYSVRVTSGGGSVTSVAAAVNMPFASIADQPFSTKVPHGGRLHLRVVPTATDGLSYQWRKGGVNIPGATFADFVIPSVLAADAGSYSVVVTSPSNSVTSDPAVVTVLPVDNVLWQQFTEFSTENGPSRLLSDGAGKLYVFWTVQGQIPDIVGGKAQGALVRLNEADGSVDTSFRVDRRFASVNHIALQPDGRILAAVSVGNAFAVVRFNSDGTTDSTFNSPLFARGLRFITRQADGKVLVASTDNLVTAPPANSLAQTAPTIARLNADGSLDTDFTPAAINLGGLVFGPPVADAAGRVYLAGAFSSINGTPRFNVARLNADGSVDTAFAANLPAGWASVQARGVGFQSDGRAVFAGDFRYNARGTGADTIMAVRFNTDGSFDDTFAQPLRSSLGIGGNLRLRWLEVLPNDQILAISDRLVRLHADGSRDATFISRSLQREGFWFARGANGRIYAPDQLGVFGLASFLPTWGNGIATFNANGVPDLSFQTGGWGRVTHTSNGLALSDGRVWMAGSFNRYNGAAVPGVAQFNANGTLTATQAVFPINSPFAAQLQPFAAIAPAANDQIYVAFMNAGNTFTGAYQTIQRLNANGSVDDSFSPVLPSGYGLGSSALHGTADGKLILSQSSVSAPNALAGAIGNALLRLNANGTADTGFTPGLSSFAVVERDANNVITAIRTGGLTVNQVLADNRILLTVASIDGTLRLQRLNANGTLDEGFVTPSFGNVLISSGFTTNLLDPVRNVSGQWPISTYTASGVVNAARQVASGQIYVGGGFHLDGSPRGLVRLNANGSLDASFNSGGAGIAYSGTDGAALVTALTSDADGFVYVAGRFDSYNGVAVPGLFRLTPNGVLDTAWAPNVGVYARPFINVRLQAQGSHLYLFGSAGGPNDPLPTPFRIVSLALPPTITAQPQSQTPVVGTTLVLTVTSNESGATYQWFKDGVAINGAVLPFYAVPNVQSSANGSYTVVVTGSGGSTTSAAAVVAVNTTAAPVILDAPFSRKAVAGGNVAFRVTAAGTTPFTYQWRRNGADIPGATGSELYLSAVAAAAAADYSVVVTNSVGSTPSANATLTVLPADNVLWQQFGEFSTEHSPARLVHDGNGKVYVPWSVQDRGPDMAAGRVAGALARFDEATGTYDPGFKLDLRYRRASHAVPLPNGQVVVAVSVADTNTVIRVNSDGSRDTTFSAPNFARSIRFITVQGDGKVIVVASDNFQNNTPAGSLFMESPGLTRLNADGSIDAGFAPASFGAFDNLFGPPVVDTAGRIYLVGAFTSVNGAPRTNIARLNANGTLDPNYATSLPAGFASNQGRGVALQSDGRAVFVGDFRYGARGTAGDPIMALRFNVDGTLDSTFAQPLRSQAGFNPQVGIRMRYLVMLPDDSFVGVSDRLVKFNAHGLVEPTFPRFPFDRETFWVSRGSNGKFFVPDLAGVAGIGTQLPLWGNGIATFTATGLRDFAFQTGGFGRVSYATSGRVLSNGDVWLAGVFNRFGSTPLPALARFTQPGALAAAQFAAPAAAPAHARSQPFASVAAAAGDQTYVIWSQAGNVIGTFYATLLRLNDDGSTDSSFTPQLPANYNLGSAQAYAAGAGKLLLAQGTVAAQVALNGGTGDALIRLNADGSRDTAYTPNLSSFAIVERDPNQNNTVTMIRTGGLNVAQVLPDGRALVIVSAVDGNLRLQRLNADGSLDTSFNAPSFGTITPSVGFTASFLFDPVTGESRQFHISTYSASDLIRTALQMPDGKVYVAGRFQLAGAPRGLVRLHANGTLDAGFTGVGVVNSTAGAQPYVSALAVDAAGRLYVAGRFTSFNGNAASGLMRLTADGAFDSAWSPGFGIVDKPVATAALTVANNQLYVFGTPGGANDQVPASYRVTSVSPVPQISVQPVATTAPENGTAILSVTASGPGTLGYQWYRNGVAINGATSNTLSVAPVNAESAGSFHVVITSSFGSTTSNAVALNFTPSKALFPANGAITTTFGPQVLPAGTSSALVPTLAAGTRPMSFQWKFNGTDIPGATNETYFLHDWQQSDSGAYSVVVTNALGTTESPATPIYLTPEAGWRWRNPTPTGNGLTRVSFVNGQFIIGGIRGTLLVSTDGVNWETRHVPAANNLFGFRYVNGQYVTLGSLNLILTSTDGYIWTPRDAGLDGSVTQLQDMTYGNGRFVAVGTGGITARSTDGITWTQGTVGNGITETLVGITYVLNRFWVVGTGTGRVYSSVDGETWTWSQTPVTNLRNLTYGAGRLVAVGPNGAIVTSTNGTTWTAANSGTTQQLIGVDFVNGRFVASGANGTILTSFDGNTWTARASAGNQSNLQSTAFGNGRYVMVGQAGNTGRVILTSTDSANWNFSISGPRQGTHLLGAAASNTTIVAVGNGGTILSSGDAATWTDRASSTGQNLNDVTFAAGKFLAVGTGGAVVASTDGLTWTNVATTGLNGAGLNGVRYDGTKWVAVSGNSNVYTSTDHVAWTAHSTPAGNPLRKLVIAGGQYLAVAVNGAIVGSTDGTTWSSRLTGNGTALQDITYGNGTYVAVGNAGQVFTSTDGSTWTPRSFTYANLSSVNFVSGHFITTGNGHQYYTSTDGINWTGRFTGAADSLNDTVFFNEQVVGIGNFGTILTAGAPVLVGPQSQTASAGSTVVLKAVVSEAAFPVDYVWTHNGNLIEGVNSPILIIPNASPANAGEYIVTAVTPLGSDTSEPATLTLNVGVAITTQPQPQTVIVGGTAEFSVVATGLPAPTYQWRRNGLDLAGATSPTLRLSNLALSDAGQISVVVRNAAGSVTSDAVALTVNPVAPFITSPSAVTALVNAPFSYQITTNQTPATFTASPIPAGMFFDGATGTLTGAPTQTGVFNITLTAENASGTNQRVLQLTVQPPPPVITSAASAGGRVGQAFNYTITATNSPTFYNAIGLPPGLALNGNVISGTPTVAGFFTVLVTAQNATGSNSAILSLGILAPLNAPVFTGSPNVAATAGAAINYTPNFGAGVTNYTLVDLPDGSASVLPSGLSLSANTGAITGSTSDVGVFPLAIRATNADGSATALVTLTINPAPTAPRFTSATSVVGTVGAPFAFTLTTTPSAASYAASGLPAGLQIDPATGAITGTPTAPGISVVGIAALNGAGLSVGTLTITVNSSPNAPVLTSSPIVLGRAGTALSGVQLTATNAPTGFAVINGTLPSGVSLNPTTGELTGAPNAAGESRVWLAASNGFGRGPALEMIFIVERALNVPVVTSNGTASGQVGQSFVYQTTATNTPTSFAATQLPGGLSFDSVTGLISGIPTTETTAPFNVLLTATNADGTSAPKILALSIAAPAATPRITSSNTAGGRVGTALTYQITASENPTSFAATNLPAGLEVNPTTGAIIGTPSVAGTFAASVRAANNAGQGQATIVTFTIASAPTAPAITSEPNANGKVGVVFNYQITATGSPTSFALIGTLPDGLSLNTSTGLISGNPADDPRLYAVAITASNEAGSSQPQTLLLAIAPADNAPVITSPVTRTTTVGASFTYQITATNVPNTTPFPPSVFLDAINLPPGLAVNPSTGLIAGTPTQVGTYQVSLVGVNEHGTGLPRTLTITVNPAPNAPVIGGAANVSAQVGTPFAYTITATNSPTSFEALDAPAWLLVNTATGALAGTPTAPGSFVVQLRAANAGGASNLSPLTINVAAAPNTPVVTGQRTANGKVGVSFHYAIEATLSPTSYFASGLPAGLSINSNTGEITGTPTVSGTFTVTISATNANGPGQPVPLVLTIESSLQLGN